MTTEPSKKPKNINGFSRNDEEEIIESYVSFEYQVAPQPSKIDSKGNKWYIFRLFISLKGKLSLNNIEKVVYLLPSSFDPQNVASQDPRSQFSIELEALGGFYVMAVIIFKNTGEKLKLSQYLPNGNVVTDPSIISTDPAAYWTDFAMKQAQKWTSLEQKLFGSEQSKHPSEQDSPS